MISYLFKSLYKNQIVVEERKKHGWWVSLIFALLALFITIIPPLVSGLSVRGSSLITASTNYEIDRGLYLFSQDEYVIEIGDDDKIKTVDQRLQDTYSSTSATPIVYSGEYQNTAGETVNAVLLQVFYYDGDPLASKEERETFNTWADTNILKKDSDGKITVAPHSYMIISKSFFSITLYRPTNTDTAAAATNAYTGLYNNIDPVFQNNMKNLLGADYNETIDNWKIFLNDAYESTKMRSLTMNLLMSGGMNLILIGIATLALFLFLRSKRLHEIIGDFSFLDAFKVAGTFAFSPAIISILLGLLLGNSSMFGTLSFILPYGMRVMWLVSKNSGAGGGKNEQKPVYQART